MYFKNASLFQAIFSSPSETKTTSAGEGTLKPSQFGVITKEHHNPASKNLGGCFKKKNNNRSVRA